MTIARRQSVAIKIGNVQVGNGAPISIQSMTKTKTTDVRATLEQMRQRVLKEPDILINKTLYGTSIERVRGMDFLQREVARGPDRTACSREPLRRTPPGPGSRR